MSEVEWKRVYYINDQLWSETPHVNGQAHGVAKFYHDDGVMFSEITYVNGQRHGVEKTYWPDGKIERHLYIHGINKDNLLEEEHRLERLILLGTVVKTN